MSQWTRGANPIWWLPDLTGVSLNDQYYAFFLTNDLPYIPQSVFQDPNGISPWANPLQFSPAGTLSNNLYFDDTLTYRIEIRMGNTQNDPLIWLIENYQVSGSGSGPTSDTLITAENLITNPQFADIYFQSPLTYANASPGTYTLSLAPGWQLVLTGSGTTTVTQSNTSGNQEIPGNPSYYLEVNNSGWTSVQLIQKFSNNGAIFNLGAIGVAFSAFANSSAQVVTVSYSPSTGSPTTILAPSVSTGSFQQFGGAINLPSSTNSDEAEAAFVNIIFSLPGTSDVALSNIQITGQEAPLINTAIIPVYQELTYERMVDHEFNVYKEPLIFKPIPSYLVGWDFLLNPAQFYGSTVGPIASGANTSNYVWDQTIMFQSVDNSFLISNNGAGLQLAPQATGQFAFIQYLPAPVVNKILSDNISVNIRGSCNTAQTVKGTVSLWYTKGSALPDIKSPNYKSIVATLDANGKPATFNNPTGGTWIEVPKSTQQNATFIFDDTAIKDFGFNFWIPPASSEAVAATFFAIVIGYESIPTTKVPQIISVGLCSGSIPTIPAPQTPDEVLRECQYYYEKSYSPSVAPGAVTPVGVNSVPATVIPNDGSANEFLYTKSFYLRFQQTKRVIGDLHLYSPATGTIDNAYIGIYQNGGNPTANSGSNPRDIVSSSWVGSSSASVDGVDLISQNTSTEVLEVLHANTLVGDEGVTQFHYVVDSRLGVI